MSKIIEDIVEMRNFTTEGITVNQTYILPSAVESAVVEIWAAGDFSGSSEYIIAKVDGIQIGGNLSTGSDDSTMRNVLTYDLTSLVLDKQEINLAITTSSSMNPNVGVSGGTSCWVDWRFSFEVSNIKLLVEDGEDIKVWNETNNSYEKVGDMPISEELFINFGMDELPKTLNGLISNAPKLHLYTNDESIVNSPEGYRLRLIEKKSSLPKIVIENTPRILKEKISLITIDDYVSDSGDISYALSKDKLTWYTFDSVNSNWQTVDITNDSDFLNKGMKKSDFLNITESNYEDIFSTGDSLYLAIRFYKDNENDECKFLGIKISYINPVHADI